MQIGRCIPIFLLGSSGRGRCNERALAEDRDEDERRQKADCGQQRERDGAGVGQRGRKIVSSEFEVQAEAAVAGNVSLRQSRSFCIGGRVSENCIVLVDVVVGVVLWRAIQQTASWVCKLMRNGNEKVIKQTLTQRSNFTRFYAGGVGSEYSTAIYAELYNGSDSAIGGGGGGVRNAGVANAGYEEGDDERSEGSTNSENSGSGGSGVNKKVKFNESVAVKVRGS